MLTTAQKLTAQNIVTVFETGHPLSKEAYAAVCILNDGAGISYGKSQVTDRGGNLDLVVQRYLDLRGVLADAMEPYLDLIHRDESAKANPKNPPAWVVQFMNLLKKAGLEDPIMHRAQDEIFDEQYWNPAYNQGVAAGLAYPLSFCALYDTAIQSGPGAIVRMRRLFAEASPSNGGDESLWLRAYVTARHEWLSTFKSALTDPNPAIQAAKRQRHEETVHKSTYRTRELLRLVELQGYTLEPPLTIMGQKL